MPAFILVLPAFIVAFLAYLFMPPMKLAYAFVPCLVYFMAIYMAGKSINMWWYKRHPPRLDPELLKVIERFYPYYMRLSDSEKLRFEKRLNLFNEVVEYLTQELPEVPPDVMALISSTAIQLTFGLEDFMFERWEKVVLYRQAFHTPRFKEFHTGEIHEEDGVIILAIDPVIKGINRPKDGYNMAIHQMAMAWASENRDLLPQDMLMDVRGTEDEYLSLLFKLCKIRNWPQRFEKEYVGMAPQDIFGLCVEHFFNAPAPFSKELPQLFEALKKLLNQDPLNRNQPVIKPVKVTRWVKDEDDSSDNYQKG